MEQWKSPRRIQAEEEACWRTKLHDAFESYMQTADEGLITRTMAIMALRDEVKNDFYDSSDIDSYAGTGEINEDVR